MLKKSWEGMAIYVLGNSYIEIGDIQYDLFNMLDELFSKGWEGKKVKITVEAIEEEKAR